MNLQTIDLPTRKRLTRLYPMLISSKPKAGKSRSMEQLTPEDRQRTVFIDLENKGLPNLFDEDFFRIIRLKPEGQIKPEMVKLYTDYENVQYKTLTELKAYIRKVMSNDKVDRVVVDSFTALVDQLESHYVTVSNGFTTWKNYNAELTDWFSLFKEETRFNAKFLYILGHYTPAKPTKGEGGKLIVDHEAENFTKVKGNQHYRMVEANFNTVITIEDRKFVADNDNEWDSTRINERLNPLETGENSIGELEELIAREFCPQLFEETAQS